MKKRRARRRALSKVRCSSVSQERPVPHVQLDLAVGDRADHDHQGAGEDAEPDPVAGRRDQRAQQTQELRRYAAIRRGRLWPVRLYSQRFISACHPVPPSVKALGELRLQRSKPDRRKAWMRPIARTLTLNSFMTC
jgi:hypothetical protein